MAGPAVHSRFTGVARLKLFWALSRTPHGLLDMCTPAFAALVWLGAFPPLPVALIGIVTAFAGYTAVYALNDVVDYRVDREKANRGGLAVVGSDLDGLIVRHPMAQGLLGFGEGLAWALFWSTVAVIGASLLNPLCVVIFAGGSALEAIYCRLWRVSPYRTLVSGAVKTSGAVAAVVAVDPHPALPHLAVLFLALFAWEVGGQNIPNDLADLEEDRRMNARTLPICFGTSRAAHIALVALAAALLLTAGVFLFSPLPRPGLFALLSLAAAWYLLIDPGRQLFRSPHRAEALALFNRASYYPPAMLGLAVISLLAGHVCGR